MLSLESGDLDSANVNEEGNFFFAIWKSDV